MPNTWEDRFATYIAALIKLEREPQTIKSYISAVKAVLSTEQIYIKEDSYILGALVKACKVRNGMLFVRLPTQKGLLRLLIYQTTEYYQNRSQDYLCTLYKAMIATAYNGLLRVSRYEIYSFYELHSTRYYRTA